MTRRRFAVVAVVLGLLPTAACASSSSATSTTGTSSADTPTTVTPTLAPWQGSLTTTALPAGVQSLRAVSCPTSTRCFAVGAAESSSQVASAAAIVTSADGGARWTTQAVPPSVGYLAGIDCTSRRDCTAVGQVGGTTAGPGAVLTTADAGATWSLQAVPPGTSDITALYCGSGGWCAAVGTVGGRQTALTSTAIGAPWTAGGVLPATVSSVTGISCTDAAHCWASGTSPVDTGHVAGAVLGTADGGMTWALQPIPPGIGALEDVSCSSTVPTMPGAGSSAASGPSGTSGSSDTSGPTGTAVTAPVVACTAVGTTAATIGDAGRTGQGVVISTTDSGVVWSSEAVTGSSADLLGVSCGAGPCVAVGTTVAASPQAGIVVLSAPGGAGATRWHRAVVATVGLSLAGVSCRSLASCVVVGESISAHLAA